MTSAAHPQILSAALFQRDDRVLTAHRRPGRPPFAGQWLPPMTPVLPSETAEGAASRHAREQFGVDVSGEAFVDTVYLEDPDDAKQYVANIFRATLGGGPMRFRADGDYDDARWLAASEIEQVWMPPPLREPLLRALSEPDAPPPDVDWTVAETASEAVPLAERAAKEVETPPAGPEEPPPSPDNRAAWDAIAGEYQAWHERFGERLRWARGVYDDELRLLDDVRGKRAIVLGCGGGQDVVALERMGAVAVGVDFSPAQIAYARKYAAKGGADNASFAQCDITDLSRFDDESFDLAVSIYALGFVEDAAQALREAGRVLKSSGVLAIAVPHPWNQVFDDQRPYRATRSYWAPYIDWNWDEAKFGERGRLRDFRRTIAEWFGLLADAGFMVERLLEPYQGDVTGDDAEGFDVERARLMPSVLILKARKR